MFDLILEDPDGNSTSIPEVEDYTITLVIHQGKAYTPTYWSDHGVTLTCKEVTPFYTQDANIRTAELIDKLTPLEKRHPQLSALLNDFDLMRDIAQALEYK